jgi:hypothetical protein
MTTTFEELSIKYGSNKHEPAQRYHLFYEELWGERRDQVTAFLEVGLALAREYAREGKVNRDVYTSLRIWLDYFPNAEVYGFDRKDFSWIDMPRMTIFRGDQGSEESLSELVAELPPQLDGIVDDGSHIAKHQQLTLEHLFPLVRSGGCYVIEDLHIEFDYDPKESGIRTIDLLRRWQQGDWYCPGMDQSRFEYLRDNIAGFSWGYIDRVVGLHKR